MCIRDSSYTVYGKPLVKRIIAKGGDTISIDYDAGTVTVNGELLPVSYTHLSPRAVRSILGSVRLAAPALVCGGTMAYHYADGNRVPLCSFAQQQELCLLYTSRCV